jgi:hypothetical protein
VLNHDTERRTYMTSSRIRELIVVLVASAVGAGSLLVAGSALADVALFRIEQRSNGFPSPPVTPGGAGQYVGYLIPYYLDVKTGGYNYPPAVAVNVAPGNPIGGAFTLPQSFLTSYYDDTLTPKTAWPGYTTTYYYHVYNGPGKFRPNNGPTAPYRMFFPTTGGNAAPNYGLGNPATPTTTFDGRYDVSRGGSMNITPGENRFGGTFKMFFLDSAHWDQYIYYYTPVLYSGFGDYFCFADGLYDCGPDTFVSEPGTTAIYNGIWWLLTELGKAKATTPTKPGGVTPTPYGNASYVKREQHYLNLIHPWTTGFASAKNEAGNQGSGTITPQQEGYDTTLDNATISVKKINYNQVWDKTLLTLVSTTSTPYTQILKGVTRVVSMVRPHITWTMAVPLDPSVDPIENIWTPVRMAELTVFFLPEPGGMLMLGVGIASLLGLSRMRRR